MKNWLIYKILRRLKNFVTAFIQFISWETGALVTEITEHFQDKRLRIETSQHLQFQDNSLNQDMHVYLPSPYSTLKLIIASLKLNPNDIVIDYGCGKGRVVFMFATQKLKKVLGVDLNEEMLAVARRNLKTFKYLNSPVEFICADAASFDVREITVFFLYNPFGYKTLIGVIRKIKESLLENPRNIRIVYFCPTYGHLLEDENWLELENQIKREGVSIWRNKALS
ncbi:MAG: class I SAM-dependent methyltransferase [Candidatus Omnitrophica bacterium]|nr:class I SAM-dependent methyltransferase [Candidatus Omnitrophota bacterium]MBU1869910.1 class I SAM-dependent methyltransferase [Candidatus Omnitrophota bacterium]